MAVNTKPQNPVPRRPNWLPLCTGGLLTIGGLGWCLRLSYARDPKMAVATYLVGSAGVCLKNASFYYRPAKTSSIPNWIMRISGEILSGAGFWYCLRVGMEEHPKSTTLAFIVGSLGYLISNAAIYFGAKFENGRKRASRLPNIEVSLDELFHIPKCGNPKILLVDGMYQCQNCKVYFGGENAESKPEMVIATERRGDFLRKMQKTLQEMKSKREKNPTAEKVCNVEGSIGFEKKVKRYNLEDVDQCRDETTQTDSQRRMMGTQTRESTVAKRLGKKPQLQTDAEALQPEEH